MPLRSRHSRVENCCVSSHPAQKHRNLCNRTHYDLRHGGLVLLQLIHDILLRRLPPAGVLPEQRFLVALPDHDLISVAVVRLDLHAYRVAVVAVRGDLARGEDPPDAGHGGVPLLAPAVSVAGLHIQYMFWRRREDDHESWTVEGSLEENRGHVGKKYQGRKEMKLTYLTTKLTDELIVPTSKGADN